MVVPKDSPITSPADLAGAKVSVNNLKNIGDTTIRYAIEQDGGESSAVDSVARSRPLVIEAAVPVP